MKKIYFILLSAVVLLSCNNEGSFKKHESGLEYKIFKSDKADARKLNVGDVVVLNMTYETTDGTILFNSASSERKYLRTVSQPSHKGGSFEDGLLLLSEGDSAIFKVNAESFLKNSENFSKLPRNVKYDDNIIIKLRILNVLGKGDYDEFLTEKYHASKDVEMRVLENYLKNANITVEPTPSGLYYIELEPGSGKQLNPNDYVHVDYTVKLIDGNLIETSLGKEPIKFRLGSGQVIKGWEEGLLLMKEGGKALLIVPSDLAYGEKGNGKILPYSTLIFEVEVVRVQ